jgi:hypothetical protein
MEICRGETHRDELVRIRCNLVIFLKIFLRYQLECSVLRRVEEGGDLRRRFGRLIGVCSVYILI